MNTVSSAGAHTSSCGRHWFSSHNSPARSLSREVSKQCRRLAAAHEGADLRPCRGPCGGGLGEPDVRQQLHRASSRPFTSFRCRVGALYLILK